MNDKALNSSLRGQTGANCQVICGEDPENLKNYSKEEIHGDAKTISMVLLESGLNLALASRSKESAGGENSGILHRKLWKHGEQHLRNTSL